MGKNGAKKMVNCDEDLIIWEDSEGRIRVMTEIYYTPINKIVFPCKERNGRLAYLKLEQLLWYLYQDPQKAVPWKEIKALLKDTEPTLFNNRNPKLYILKKKLNYTISPGEHKQYFRKFKSLNQFLYYNWPRVIKDCRVGKIKNLIGRDISLMENILKKNRIVSLVCLENKSHGIFYFPKCSKKYFELGVRGEWLETMWALLNQDKLKKIMEN